MEIENLGPMSTEALTALMAAIQAELARRTDAAGAKVLWTHPCQEASKHHRQKYTHWAKCVIDVDTTKTNGYAWQGDFLNVEAEHLVPVASFIVWACDDTIYVDQIANDGPVQIGKASRNRQHALITEVAARMTSPKEALQ